MSGKLINEQNAFCLRYIIPDDWSKAEKNAKPIAAKNVIEAIISRKNVEIINAVIEGDFKLKSVNVEGEITIRRTEFRGHVDWSYATFKRVLNLENSMFKTDAIFTGITIEKDIFLDNANFLGRAEISDGTFTGVFHCRSTIFKEAIFYESNFKKRIEFIKSTFEGEANFSCARISGEAKFEKAEFKQKADFNGAHIEGSAYFNQVTFEGEADFTGVEIGTSVEVDNATFKELAKFNSAKIERYARFCSATFEGEADFTSVRIGSVAVFKQSTFNQNASFSRTQIGESAFFSHAIFVKKGDFTSVRIGGNAYFENANFKELAKFKRSHIEGSALFDLAFFEGEADFTSARIGSNAEFKKAEFKEKVKFDGAQIQGNTFMNTVFDDNVSFQDTSFKAIFFKENEEVQIQLKAKIDLRGCKYDRIDPISIWEQLIEYLEPYDRQPFTQLEETFRKSGWEGLANDVYYERKRRESEQKKLCKNPGIWLMDQLHLLLTGYGVRLQYLIVWIVVLLAIGTVIFHLNGAVVPNPNLKSPQEWDSQNALSYLEAFWVSFSTFLPVVIPSGADWIPSSQIYGLLDIKFTTFATFLKLTGWILVPVGIAGISGLLKR